MSMSQSSTTIKTLFVLGTTTASLASGDLLFTTYMHVPGYLASPSSSSSSSSLLSQWQTMGAIGKTLIPPLTLLSASTHFLNAYLTEIQAQRYRFLTAGAMTLAILPYTALSLASTNAELSAREQHHNISNRPDTGLRHLSVKQLIRRWGNRSAVRGFVLLASTIVGYDAMLGLTF